MNKNRLIILCGLVILLLVIDETLPKKTSPHISYYPLESSAYQVKIKYVRNISDILTILYELNGSSTVLTMKGMDLFVEINGLVHTSTMRFDCYYYFPQFKKPEATASDF